jgi:ribosomal protein S18 acetylase RimI-like enzyme
MSLPQYRIRRLDASDVHILRPVRLDALRLHPESFGASYEDEAKASPDELARRLLLPPSTMFGGFAGHDLVGITGLMAQMGPKRRHGSDLFTVYVDAAHRGTGLGRALVEMAIQHARNAGCRQVLLCVTVGNDAARQVYAGLGFRGWGIAPRALFVDGRFYDNEHMVLDLD